MVPDAEVAAPVFFSIIICTFKRTADLLSTLDSVRRMELPDGLAGELIVVDNSRDETTRRALDTFEPIPNLPLITLHEARAGKGHALNTGIGAARGEILLFTDDDVRVPPNWIKGMTRPILQGDADAVVGGIHLAPALLRPWMAPRHRTLLASTEMLNPQAPEALIGANMAVARRVYARVPFIDVEMGCGAPVPTGEDSLFSFQLLVAGYRLVGAFDISVEHHFQARRLSREAFLLRAEVEGCAAAYTAHHWQHQTVRYPFCKWLILRLKLFLKRLTRRAKWMSPEGLPVWELNDTVQLSFLRHYLRERRRPRNYTKEGLIRKDAAASFRP